MYPAAILKENCADAKKMMLNKHGYPTISRGNLVLVISQIGSFMKFNVYSCVIRRLRRGNLVLVIKPCLLYKKISVLVRVRFTAQHSTRTCK